MGTEALLHDPRDKQGAGDTAYAEGHFEAAAEIHAPNTMKARTTAQRRAEPTDTPEPPTGHCAALQRDEIQLHQF